MADHPLSIRLDDKAQRALSVLTRGGRSRSEAVRTALIEAAERERPASLAAEARALAADPEDRAEKAEIAALMDSLRAAG